jgi:hypothetical protein
VDILFTKFEQIDTALLLDYLVSDVVGSNYLEFKPHLRELLARYLITTREREREEPSRGVSGGVLPMEDPMEKYQ